MSMRTNTNDQTMSLRFINGSTFSVVGSDNYDSTIVGSSSAGVTMSEYALSNPSAWGYLQPTLNENNGWAIFISTPRGHNHCKTLFDYAKQAPGWFAELLTVRDTKALSEEQLAEALRDYVALYGQDHGQAVFDQELLCSFNASVLGSFFSLEMAQVRAENRILPVDPLPGKPVNTAWDIGMADDTSIWWWQTVGSQVFVFDHVSSSGVSLEYWRDLVMAREAERGWLHGIDYVPHDAKIREWTSGRTRVETMLALGLRPMLVPNATLLDGINAVRRTLPLCVFHPRCEAGGITALEQYRREWDDVKKAFRASAVHDWTSHPSDAFRYLSLAWKPAPPRELVLPKPTGWHIPPPAEPKRGRMQL